MDNIRLLRFRRQTKEYGIPVKDVIGITEWSWLNGLVNFSKAIPILGMQANCDTGDNKYAIIMYANGIEIALIVDEVIRITREALVPGAMKASYTMWQFEGIVESLHEVGAIKEM